MALSQAVTTEFTRHMAKKNSNTGINASSHSGRRSFITNLSEKGISTRVIQELARHSSMMTTQRYIDVSNDKLKNAVNAL